MNLSAIETASQERKNLSEWVIYLRSTLENYFRTIEIEEAQ